MVANDRGQLVLVGAVVIAFIFVGIVVVFNGVVFTESVGDQGTVTDTREGGSVGASMERTIADTAHSANTDQKYSDSDDAADELETRIGNASAPLSTMEAESGGTFANVSYIDDTEAGYRIYQPDASNLTAAPGVTGVQESTWRFTATDSEFGRLVVRIDPSESSGDGSLATYSGGTIDQELEIETAGSTVTLDGAVADPSECQNIEPAAGTDIVTIQISRGVVFDDPDCELTLPTETAGSDGMGFRTGDNLFGSFDVVLREEPAFGIREEYLVGRTTSQNDNQPNLSEVVWTAEYRIVYDAGQVETDVQKEVDHYG